MRYVVAMDSFKGCLSSVDAGESVADTLRHCCSGAEVVVVPVSDGGEGMLSVFDAFTGGRRVSVVVHDLMMRRLRVEYIVMSDGTAVIETACVVGLMLVEPGLRNPLVATSYGVGEIVADAVRRGCRRFIVGLGGSGVSDAGIGMLRSLIDVFTPGATADRLLSGVLGDCSFTIASDVVSPLCGSNGAACLFAPQKGADAAMVKAIDARAARFAALSASHFGFDRSAEPGAGAAGGLGYAFMQYLGAEMRSGADIMLDIAAFDELLVGTLCVITGEGHADRQTLAGKLPSCVLKRALDCGVPVWLVAGGVADEELLLDAGFAKIGRVSPEDMPVAYAMRPEVARANICSTIKRMMK